MKGQLAVLLVVLFFTCSLGKPPSGKFEFPPKAYHYQAELIDLIEQRVTPFEFWQSSENSLRVDYHHGLERKFMKSRGTKGTIVHYESDINGDTKLVCSEGSMHHFISLHQCSLTDLEGLDLAGEKMLNGYRIQIYRSQNKYYGTTLYMNGSIPIKLEEKGLNAINGAVQSHTVTNYFLYETEFNEEDLDVSQFCESEKSSKTSENTFNDDLIHERFNRKNNIEQEHKIRERILSKNLALIEAHNRQNLSYKLGLNQFADRTPEELKLFTGELRDYVDRELGTHPFPHTELEIEDMMDDIPEEWDWRTQGKVSRVKSQSSCGSCWAFAATAAVESALSIKHGTNFDLSEQSLVDCDWPYDSHGCQGGFAINAFKFGIQHGIPTEEDYGEYMAKNGRCHINETARMYQLKGFIAVTPMSVNALKATVYKYGPVSVSVLVTGNFHMYARGIYSDVADPADDTNHAVVVVGYGVRDGLPYWIVKNSWGQRWGEDGYILIDAQKNVANILLKPYLPIV